ncbi:hypothetical protein PBRA_007675 [Plasmodiophora brassicae]|uniref:Uncharacterized protein n=1 Tax=Plasmodiophora brassicae TaxID=37360 RepID=A0A0G4IXZ1_PLABS|nr:hypothetical protein PBRA_007675 [Plasmodiophora brassicae]
MAPYDADFEDDSVASLRCRMITQADLDAAKSAIKAQRNLPKMPDHLSVLRCIEHYWFNLLRQPSRTRARAGRDAVLHILQKESTHAARRVRNLALESQRTGDVNESGQGRHAKRNRIIDIEFVRADCTAMLDDRRRTSVRQFHEWLNQHLEHHGSQMVTERTSRKSLTIDLGFRRHSRKKGVYYDGHDREDVQQYLHDMYIPALEWVDSRCRKYDGDTMEVEFQRENISLPEIRKFFHDESIFYTDDAEKHYYARDGDQVLRKKSLSRCLHVSDMISEDCGFLDLQKALSSSGYEQLQRAGTLPANTKSRGIIRPGKNADGWWDHEQLVDQVIHFMDLFEIAYPGEIVCLFFDCSTNHAAFAKDALVVNRMNINPGGPPGLMFMRFTTSASLANAAWLVEQSKNRQTISPG